MLSNIRSNSLVRLRKEFQYWGVVCVREWDSKRKRMENGWFPSKYIGQKRILKVLEENQRNNLVSF